MLVRVSLWICTAPTVVYSLALAGATDAFTTASSGSYNESLVSVMSDVDLRVFVNTFNAELQRFHPNWQSRIDAGATRTATQLWAGSYLVRLDLTENHLEPGEPGEGSRKYDEIRMVILRDSRDPMGEATWLGSSSESVATRIWQSVDHGGEVRWTNENGTEITIEQVFSAIRAELTRVIEEENR